MSVYTFICQSPDFLRYQPRHHIRSLGIEDKIIQGKAYLISPTQLDHFSVILMSRRDRIFCNLDSPRIAPDVHCVETHRSTKAQNRCYHYRIDCLQLKLPKDKIFEHYSSLHICQKYSVCAHFLRPFVFCIGFGWGGVHEL